MSRLSSIAAASAGLLFPVMVTAQSAGFSSTGAGAPRVSGAEPTFLQPFKFIAPSAQETAAKDVPKRTPLGEQVVKLSQEGNYQQAGDVGLTVMAQEKPDPELQLMIANSLAWTGRLEQATGIYQGLSGTPYATSAKLGIANINRWRGRDDLALPMLRQVLAQEPDNPDAIESLAQAQRNLAPKTTLRAFTSNDSSDLHRRMASVAHSWYGEGGADRFEIELSGFRDFLPPVQTVQKDVTLRYESKTLPLKPALELNITTQLNPAFYGTARVKVLNDQLEIVAGRINWGKDASNPNAQFNALAANTLGLRAEQSLSWGKLRERIDWYNISDGNSVVTSGINLDSSWRPLGEHVKPFVGIETRTARANKPGYWSPIDGYGAAYAGLMLEWSQNDWNMFVSGQVGRRLYGEAGSSWSVSAGGKTWISKDVALGFNGWSMSSWRDGSAYRARSADVFLEKIWP